MAPVIEKKLKPIKNRALFISAIQILQNMVKLKQSNDVRRRFMTKTSMRDNIIAQIDKLPSDLQLRVLNFAKALMPKGVEGKSLLKFSGSISAEDLQLMSKAIEENCEKVDIGEW